MSYAPRWITARQTKPLKCGNSEKGYDTFYDTMPKNHHLGKSLTTPVMVLEKKNLHE